MQGDKIAEVQKLGEDMRILLEKYLPQAPKIANPYMQKVKAISKTITEYGYLVRWQETLNPISYKVTVVVEILEPKKDMSTSEQKIYDAWFLEANKINPDEK